MVFVTFDTTDAQIVRPYSGLHVKIATRLVLTGTDARAVHPYKGLHDRASRLRCFLAYAKVSSWIRRGHLAHLSIMKRT